MDEPLNSEDIDELTEQQVNRLEIMISEPVTIHKRQIPEAYGLTDMQTTIRELIKTLHGIMNVFQIVCTGVFLVGGAATNVVAPLYDYTDFDIVLELEESDDANADAILGKARTVVTRCLQELYDNQTGLENARDFKIFEKVFVGKKCLIKDNSESNWSLFSLHNIDGKCIDIKFVVNMARCYEFSIDSLQIDLQWILDQCALRPPVMIRSRFGNVKEAIYHAQNQLIETKNAEKIRLGGLLKYCLKKTQGFGDVRKGSDLEKLIREMVCRFFMDYMEITSVSTNYDPISTYLFTHFEHEANAKTEQERKEILEKKERFLHKVIEIIENSEVDKLQDHRRSLLKDLESQITAISIEITNIGLQLNDDNFPALS